MEQKEIEIFEPLITEATSVLGIIINIKVELKCKKLNQEQKEI